MTALPLNPDDPDNDCPEVASWFDIDHLAGMPALRPELASDLPRLLPVLHSPVVKAAKPRTKAEVNYRHAPGVRDCGNCSMFAAHPPDFESGVCLRPDGSVFVEGLIQAADFCDEWVPTTAKAADPRLAGSSIDEDSVLDYLKEHYPTADLGWVARCLWSADNVMLDDVDWQSRPGGIDRQLVDEKVAKLGDGWQPKPVVLVAPSAEDPMMVADGYHRLAAYDRFGQDACSAWVGIPKPGNTGWRADIEAMQFTARNHAAGKAATLKYSDDEPRDDQGKWTSGGGGPAGSSATPAKAVPPPPGPGKPVHTSDVNEAARLLGAGKPVELDSPRQVSSLLDAIQKQVQDAVSKGDAAPTYNLCDVSVPGTNLFCADNKGIPRVQMPQLSGPPQPGSPADSMPRDVRGNVDLTPAFVDHLKNDLGVSVTPGTEDAAMLKASQDELDGVKVAGIYNAMLAGKLDVSPTLVSSDNYIVDGHHRWAAQVSGEESSGGSMPIPVDRINMGIIPLLHEAVDWTTKMGIPPAGFAAAMATNTKGLADPDLSKAALEAWLDVVFKDWNEADHPRDEHGRFTSTGGGSSASGGSSGGSSGGGSVTIEGADGSTTVEVPAAAAPVSEMKPGAGDKPLTVAAAAGLARQERDYTDFAHQESQARLEKLEAAVYDQQTEGLDNKELAWQTIKVGAEAAGVILAGIATLAAFGPVIAVGSVGLIVGFGSQLGPLLGDWVDHYNNIKGRLAIENFGGPSQDTTEGIIPVVPGPEAPTRSARDSAAAFQQDLT